MQCETICLEKAPKQNATSGISTCEWRCNGLELCTRRISCSHAFWCLPRPILAIFHIANVFLSGLTHISVDPSMQLREFILSTRVTTPANTCPTTHASICPTTPASTCPPASICRTIPPPALVPLPMPLIPPPPLTSRLVPPPADWGGGSRHHGSTERGSMFLLPAISLVVHNS